MDEKQLADLLRYSNSKQLYIVTWNNILKLLFCPFKVLVLVDIGLLKQKQTVWVEEVKITQELKTVYIIKGQAYYYHYFDIIVDDE